MLIHWLAFIQRHFRFHARRTHKLKVSVNQHRWRVDGFGRCDY